MNLEIIKNFVPEALALQMVNNIYNMPYDWWFHSYKFQGSEEARQFRYCLQEQQDKRLYETKIVSSMRSGFFSYKFSRTLNHRNGCTCFLCTEVPQILLSGNLKKTISKYYPEANLEFSEFFISRYSSGDFLSRHSDHTKGIAFVWNLTQDWRPEYGGNLSLIDPDTQEIRTLIPQFNTLSLFNLQEEVDHWVSEVSSFAPKERIAITGWFDKNAL